MAEAARSENVNRFVASARRLIAVQIVVALVALLAAGVAGGVIYLAILEQEKSIGLAKTSKELAEVAEKAQAQAKTEKDAALAAIAQSELLAGQLQQARLVLTATLPEDYASAADSLSQTLNENGGKPDRDFLALLATAYYRSADIADPETRRTRLVSAANAALGAIKADLARAPSVSDTASDVGTDTGEAQARTSRFVMDYIGMACAQAGVLADEGQTAAANMANYLAFLGVAVAIPEAVRKDVAVGLEAGENALINGECSPELLQVIRGFGLFRADESELGDVFEIEKIFLHIGREQERSISGAISDSLKAKSGLQVPRVDLIKTSYRPSVRYYYDEQFDRARSLQAEILEAAAGAGAPNWSEDVLPLIKVNRKDLPRDRLEVWLPQIGAETPEFLGNIRVDYLQRPNDGPNVRLVIQRLVPEGRFTISTPRISADQVNMVACHRNAPPAAFADFKTLTIALIEAGVPLRRIVVFTNTDPGEDAVQILASNKALEQDLLTRADVEALTSCPLGVVVQD